MFRVKICGITNKADALEAARLGADAVGLNFYSKSARCIARDVAREVVKALPEGVARVGVFVNTPASQIAETMDELGLDYVQLHGDESPQVLAELKGRPLIRAFRCGDESLTPAKAYLEDCARLGCVPCAVLVDAVCEGSYGGTGRIANWKSMAETRDLLGKVPLILAGGLSPENVGEAIRLVRPDAVDVASGVETSARRKDAKLMQRFIETALNALAPG